ncbi:MAG: glutathione-disulfide reductase [Gammaproteobacteria bacterium]|nr:glutathione-disulfide reductase [Gammaproteobacteria bacterium]
MQHYDLICIGGGSGGLAAAKRAAEYGAKALVIEAKKLGGTCVNVGCVPKKIMWHAAQIAEFSHLATDYGFNKLSPTLDYNTFANKRDAFIEKLNGIYANGLKKSNVDTITGYAKFVDKNIIAVGDKTYTAEHIIIAVGGEPLIPEIEGADFGMDSDDFFALRELPQSIAVVGAGYIAVELAGVMNALGVDTHLIVRKNRFLKQIDDDIYEILCKQMQKDGVNIHFESEITHVTDNATPTLTLELNTGNTLAVEKLLWAIGRTPMTEAIGLSNTDIKTHNNGNIIIDDQQNTSQSGVYAIGDITGQPTLTPAAIEAGRQLAERLFNNKAHAKANFTFVPTVIFSHPAIATVGMTENEAIETHGKESVTTYQSTFNPLLRSMTEHKVPTRMKMICAGDDEIVIGLHLIGDFVDEVIQGFAVAVQMGAKKADFDRTLAIHPTSGEELVTMR